VSVCSHLKKLIAHPWDIVNNAELRLESKRTTSLRCDCGSRRIEVSLNTRRHSTSERSSYVESCIEILFETHSKTQFERRSEINDVLLLSENIFLVT